MKNLRIFLVKYEMRSIQVLLKINTFSEIDQIKLKFLKIISTIDIENEADGLQTFLICDSTTVSNYSKILDKYDIKTTVEDITSMVLDDILEFKRFIKKNLDGVNTIMHKPFIRALNIIIKSNLELDPILDKINKKGFDNLSKLEKEYLKTY